MTANMIFLSFKNKSNLPKKKWQIEIRLTIENWAEPGQNWMQAAFHDYTFCWTKSLLLLLHTY